MKNVAIVLSAGSGKRMGANRPKQYLLLDNKPIIYYSLKTFEDSFIDEVVLVVGAQDLEYCKEKIVDYYGLQKVKKIVAGGKERYHSVYNGLQAIGACDYVYIHDGARPFLNNEILQNARNMVEQFDACIVGMPVKDTIKQVDDNFNVVATPNRDYLYQVQTPQVFSYDLIENAYKKLLVHEKDLANQKIKITDDAMVVETFMKKKIYISQGSYYNIKVTTPEDLDIAKLFLSKHAR